MQSWCWKMADPSVGLTMLMLPFFTVAFLVANLPIITVGFVVLFVIVGVVTMTRQERRRE